MTAVFTNPVEKSCWETCQACFRCQAKGTYLRCQSCSGRLDEEGVIEPYIDDACMCTQGILRWRKKNGELVHFPYTKDPFQATVTREEKLQDEADWEAYVNDLREKHDDEHLNPIEYYES